MTTTRVCLTVTSAVRKGVRERGERHQANTETAELSVRRLSLFLVGFIHGCLAFLHWNFILQLKGLAKYLPFPFLFPSNLSPSKYTLQLTLVCFLTLSHLTYTADVFFPGYFVTWAFAVLDFSLGLSALIYSLAQI